MIMSRGENVARACAALVSAGSIDASPHSGHCSFRLISPPMRFPPQAVIGGSSCTKGLQPLASMLRTIILWEYIVGSRCSWKEREGRLDA